MALVRTRPALCNVPVELLDEIVSLASQEDLIALSRVCKPISLSSTRSLYRDVDLHNARQTIKFCRTLIRNKRAALSVRMLYACFTSPPLTLKAFWSLFILGLESATKIVDLQFGLSAPDFISAAANRISFQGLRIFSDQSHCVPPHIIPFLRRHPTMEQLYLYHRFDIFNKFPLPLTGVVLPHLRIYEGPSHIVHLVIPGSSVSEARIWWGSRPDDPSDFDMVLSSLAKSSVPVTTLTCSGYCRKLEILRPLAKYMVDIVRLEFVTSDASVTADEFTQALSLVVEQLKHLQAIRLVCLEADEPTVVDLDSDYKILLTWDYLCPSLIVATLGSSITWFRYNTKIWLPNVTEHQELCRDWIKHALENNTFIALANFLTQMRELQDSEENFKEFLMRNAAPSCPLQFGLTRSK